MDNKIGDTIAYISGGTYEYEYVSNENHENAIKQLLIDGIGDKQICLLEALILINNGKEDKQIEELNALKDLVDPDELEYLSEDEKIKYFETKLLQIIGEDLEGLVDPDELDSLNEDEKIKYFEIKQLQIIGDAIRNVDVKLFPEDREDQVVYNKFSNSGLAVPNLSDMALELIDLDYYRFKYIRKRVIDERYTLTLMMMEHPQELKTKES